ncbi:MAG: hypothetical protein WA118_09995 [Carboxydocellales bacterium]
MFKKYVYLFQEGKVEMKSLLGGKGANLAEMTNIVLPVPQDSVIVCAEMGVNSWNSILFSGSLWQPLMYHH